MSETSKMDAGKWCAQCKTRHPVEAFGKDRTRGDGLAVYCLSSRRTGRPYGWHGRPANNPLTGRPGPAPQSPRDGDKAQARQRINVEVRTGRRSHPNTLPCADCGHVHAEGERRHEYDHHLGYAPEHHYSVESVCTTCHSARCWKRQEITSEALKIGGAARSAKRKKHCTQGHPMVRYPDGGWRCRECRLAYFRKYNAARVRVPSLQVREWPT